MLIVSFYQDKNVWYYGTARKMTLLKMFIGFLLQNEECVVFDYTSIWYDQESNF